MSDLFAARCGMASSLAFHIIFACVGIGIPLLMVIAEGMYLKTRKPVYLTLANRWAKGTAILFAVGAVSGTVVAFQLGLLWPGFMRYAGAIIGMPFSLEGSAFFTEAIFLGIYLYGRDRVPGWFHWLSGVIVALSGALSGIFVVTANSWMNNPTLLPSGALNTDPVAAMFNPGWLLATTHMTLAAYLATSAASAGIHAFMLLRMRGLRVFPFAKGMDAPPSAPHHEAEEFHRAALGISLAVFCVSALAQPVSGDFSARYVARAMPEKLAALEGQFKTERGAPLRIGGIPFPSEGETRYAIEIPRGLSILAFHDPDAEVKGLEAFPADQRPNPVIVHIAFQIMVGIGSALALVALWAAWTAWRRRGLPDAPWLLRALAACAPLGFIAVEAGWTVTEVGRQPWIVYKIMRTSEAVTPMPGLVVPFVMFLLIYIFLAVVVAVLMKRQIIESGDDSHVAA